MQVKINMSIIELVKGDITQQDTEVIVNAANSGLRGGGGVDGAIHKAGGPHIMEECRKIGGCPTGGAVATSAGRLNARYVIHAVGPVYHGGNKGEAELLASAYRNSLSIALQKGVGSIAFPSISTGAYSYPLGEAALIALKTVTGFLKEHGEITIVRFVLFGQPAYKAYEEALIKLTSGNNT